MTPEQEASSNSTSPLRGEVGAKRRVRGTKVAASAVPRARTLRRNDTDAERSLWNLVRNRQLDGYKFIRQHPIGPYVADFLCREQMLIVELDGGQHAGSQHDQRRTAYLNTCGYSVLRLWNDEVLANREGCHTALSLALGGNPSPDLRFAPATLSPKGRGEEAPTREFKE